MATENAKRRSPGKRYNPVGWAVQHRSIERNKEPWNYLIDPVMIEWGCGLELGKSYAIKKYDKFCHASETYKKSKRNKTARLVKVYIEVSEEEHNES